MKFKNKIKTWYVEISLILSLNQSKFQLISFQIIETLLIHKSSRFSVQKVKNQPVILNFYSFLLGKRRNPMEIVIFGRNCSQDNEIISWLSQIDLIDQFSGENMRKMEENKRKTVSSKKKSGFWWF